MRYVVKAARGDHDIREMILEAVDADDARVKARDAGFAVVGVRPAGIRFFARWAAERSAPFPAQRFAVELLALLDAGLNVGQAVRTLANAYATAAYQSVLRRLVTELDAGQSLSAALIRTDRRVPPLLVATVQAAERTSDLQSALGRYVYFAQRIESVERQIKAVLIYPAILTFVGFAVTLFLLLHVVPRFAGIYEEISGNVPFFSAILLSVGRWLSRNSACVGSIALAAAAACAFVVCNENARTRAVRLLWLPAFVRERISTFHLTRLYRTLSMLLRSGVSFVHALDQASALMPLSIRLPMSEAKRKLQEGQSIAASFGACGLTTSIAAEMLSVGERTGDIGAMLDRVADFHEASLSRWLDTAMRVFEPALMTVLGILIGGIVVLMYMPIFELAGGLN